MGLVVMVGFEPTKHNAHDLKSGPVDRLGTLPKCIILNILLILIYYGTIFIINILNKHLLKILIYKYPVWGSNPQPSD